MAVDAVSATKVAVFAALAAPSLFCVLKHGRSGFLGWFYIHILCILRIVTGAIGLHGSQTGETYLILSSVGLSPLMLGVAGILHESRRATNPQLNRKVDFWLDIKFHTLVGLGMVLNIVAIANLISGNSKNLSTDKSLLDAGLAILCVSWAVLCSWTLWSRLMKSSSVGNDRHAFAGGKTLLNACFVVLPLIATRLGYGVAFLELRTAHPRSGFLTSVAVQICLSMLPEIISVIVLTAAGLYTHRLREFVRNREEAMQRFEDGEQK